MVGFMVLNSNNDGGRAGCASKFNCGYETAMRMVVTGVGA